MNNLQNGAPTTTQVGAYNTYVGARYVPLLVGEWDINKKYEPLSIVTNQGNSYTSAQYVPSGIPLQDNGPFWFLTGNFNGQIEQINVTINSIESNIDNIEHQIGNIKYAEYTSDGSDPSESLKTIWPELESNSVYILKLTLNSRYICYVQKYSDTIGSAIITGYALAKPIYVTYLTNWVASTISTTEIMTSDIEYKNIPTSTIPTYGYTIIGHLPSNVPYDKIIGISIVGANSAGGMTQITVDAQGNVYLYATELKDSVNLKVTVRYTYTS